MKKDDKKLQAKENEKNRTAGCAVMFIILYDHRLYSSCKTTTATLTEKNLQFWFIEHGIRLLCVKCKEGGREKELRLVNILEEEI